MENIFDVSDTFQKYGKFKGLWELNIAKDENLEEKNDNSLFPINMVLEKGTIFPELYVPYKNHEYKLKTNCDKVDLMRYTLAHHDLK